MNVTILYRNMKFVFDDNDEDCWYSLDGKSATHKKYNMVINADREVYATIEHNNKIIEGYIVDSDNSPIPDNFGIDENSFYYFRRLKKPGYYL